MKWSCAILIVLLSVPSVPAGATLPPVFSRDQHLEHCSLDRHQSVKVQRLMRRLADRFALASSGAHEFPEKFAKTKEFVEAAVARLRDLHGAECVDAGVLPDKFLNQ